MKNHTKLPSRGAGQRTSPLWDMAPGDICFFSAGNAKYLSAYGRVVGQRAIKDDPTDVRRFSVRSTDGGAYGQRVQ